MNVLAKPNTKTQLSPYLPVLRKLPLNLDQGLFASPFESVDIAYKHPSLLPKYTVPSSPIAGLEYILPPVSRLHFNVPSGLMAYKYLSLLPT